MTAQKLVTNIKEMLKKRGQSWKQNVVLPVDAEISQLLVQLAMYIASGAEIVLPPEVQAYSAFLSGFTTQTILEWIPPEATKLVEVLTIYFSEEELEDLAFGIGIDHQRLTYSEKRGLARALTLVMLKADKIGLLKARVLQARPHVAHLLD